jgi:LmbE family N-acetylglucosaminyl deacetylase
MIKYASRGLMWTTGRLPLEDRRKRGVVIVAHPDDETLWAGGAILERGDYSWTIVTVCRRSDPDRAPRFFRAVERLGATGAMADLDDGPDQRPLDIGLLERTVLTVLPRTDHDLLVTHSPFGEYTRHRRHEETSRAVISLWGRGQLTAPEMWMFAYEDGGAKYLPRAIERAHLWVKLGEKAWNEKSDIIQNTYGFRPDSWEARTTPRVEAFWNFRDAQAYRDWFKGEREQSRGSQK